MLATLNIAFFIAHTALILFNVFGWTHPRTRRWNLATLLLTLASWVGMGMWMGTGYCVCTDLHWRVREAMGIRETADSYLVLLIRTVSGWDPPLALVNEVAKWVFLFSLAMSISVNVRESRRSTNSKPQTELPLQ